MFAANLLRGAGRYASRGFSHFRKSTQRSRLRTRSRGWGLERLEDRALLSVLDPDAFQAVAFPEYANEYTITSYSDHATLTGPGVSLNATVTQDPASGQSVAVFAFDSIEVVAGETIRGVASGQGSLPVALLSQNDVVVDGEGSINFSGGSGSGSVEGNADAQAGAGGYIGGQGPSGVSAAGQTARAGGISEPGGGGGGGGFGGSGGSGGLPGPGSDGAGGMAYDANLASILQGGSGGGNGGWFAWGGGGGGALEIVANDTVKILSYGNVSVAGGAGGLEALPNPDSYGGSAGGGSGGGLLIVGNAVDVEGTVNAQGGVGAPDLGGGAGGGGGGGCVLIVYGPGAFTDPGQINVQGGSGGGNSDVPAWSGTDGTKGESDTAQMSALIPVVGALQASPDTVTAGSEVTLTATNVTGAGSAVKSVDFWGQSDSTSGQWDLSSTITAGSSGWSTTFSTTGWNPGIHLFAAQVTTDAGTTSHVGAPSAWTSVTVVVQPAFDSLAAPTIPYTTATTTLSGHIAAGNYIPTGSVSITLNGVTQTAAINQETGDFSTEFATAALQASVAPYPVTYAYLGDTGFAPVTSTASLTITPTYSPVFDSLAAPTIAYGTSAITLSGHIAAGTNVPPGTVTIAVNGVTVQAPINQSTGTFSANFSTAALGVAASPYTVSYAYAGGPGFNAASATTALVVTRRQLTVLANNKARVEGRLNPSLTYTISGFVNGDSLSVVSGAPTLITQADSASPPGSYAITLSQGTLSAANYDFHFVPGILTVTVAPPISRPVEKAVTKVEKDEGSMVSAANKIEVLQTIIAQLKSKGASNAVINAHQRAVSKNQQTFNQDERKALGQCEQIAASPAASQTVLFNDYILEDEANAMGDAAIDAISNDINSDGENF